MPMYASNLSEVLTKIRTSNCDGCVLRFSDHGFYGAVVYFQKRPYSDIAVISEFDVTGRKS